MPQRSIARRPDRASLAWEIAHLQKRREREKAKSTVAETSSARAEQRTRASR